MDSDIVCTTHCIELLIYITNCTCAKIYIHHMLVNLLHVLACHLGVLLVANVAATYFATEHFEGAVVAVPVHPRAYHRGSWGLQVQLHAFLISTLDGNEWSSSCPGCSYPWRKNLWYPSSKRLDGLQS
jgi:hypothetical protein